MMNHRDKVVVVTGAGKGIGRSIAKMYTEQGTKVVIAEKMRIGARKHYD